MASSPERANVPGDAELPREHATVLDAPDDTPAQQPQPAPEGEAAGMGSRDAADGDVPLPHGGDAHAARAGVGGGAAEAGGAAEGAAKLEPASATAPAGPTDAGAAAAVAAAAAEAAASGGEQPAAALQMPLLGGLVPSTSLNMMPSNPMLFQQMNPIPIPALAPSAGGAAAPAADGAAPTAPPVDPAAVPPPPAATAGADPGAVGGLVVAPAADGLVAAPDHAARADVEMAPAAPAADALGDAAAASGGAAPPDAAPTGGAEGMPMLAQNDQSFVCNICRKSFKREMNLIFHMTTHRQRQTVEGVGEVPNSNAPVKCSDCPKVFATKYQAKKHFLRRHFKGERPYKCKKCNKKSFTVKEDLTMHMKACGQVFTCSCGIRLCSLGALKRHAKYFKHEPTTWEGTPVVGNEFGLRGPGDDGLSGVLMHDGGKGGDDDDSDDDGAIGHAGVGSRGGMMPSVDVADGAAAQALLMADQSRAAQFDHGNGAMPSGMPQLWVPQGAQQTPDAMLRQMQVAQHHAALLSQQQQLQSALLAHPQLQMAHYNPAALQVCASHMLLGASAPQGPNDSAAAAGAGGAGGQQH